MSRDNSKAARERARARRARQARSTPQEQGARQAQRAKRAAREQPAARERAAARKQPAVPSEPGDPQRQARQRRLATMGVAVVVVLSAVAVMVAIRFAATGDESPPKDPSDPARVIAALTAVPAGVLDEVGRGGGKVNNPPKPISGQPPLTSDGKPLVLYIGAEYCPYCAAQRWAVVVALSRFGTFGDLRITRSAGSPEPLPWTPTPTFHGSSYTSPYLAFQGVETATNQRQGNRYKPLDKLTDQQQRVMKKVNAPPYVDKQAKGAIPFLDLGNRYLVAGASFDPRPIAGKQAQQIADALSAPGSPLGAAIGGTANAITAAICRLTDNQPGEVCTGRAVAAFEGKL